MRDNLHELRRQVLEAMTTGARLWDRMSKEGVEKWRQARTKERNELIMGVVDTLPPRPWVSFAALLDEYEAAVREDERGRQGV